MTDTQAERVDTLIHARWIIPVVPAETVLEQHTLAIRDKRIVGLCPQTQAHKRYQATHSYSLDEHVLIPGLVNAHGHSPMALFRGAADDIALKQWLEQHIWPMEARFVSRDFVQQGTALAMAEMIASGTTTFADMYFFPDDVGRIAQKVRMRVQLASPVMDFPTVWAQDADEYINKATRLHDDFRSSDHVTTAFGPHAPYSVADAPLEKITMLADELDVPIHMHVHETRHEVDEAMAASGQRPLARLAQLGMLSPRLLCVHATQLTDEEMQQLADAGSSVIHCPESNLKLASGFCEVDKLHRNKVNVALGTDGGASNNDLDMFGEMQTAAMLAKAVAGDASALPAHQALAMATINGARAMGLDQDIGSLEIGKLADVTAVNLDSLNTWPVNNPLSHLVYAVRASQVSHVWCGGETLLEAGELQTLDLALLKQQSADWQQALASED